MNAERAHLVVVDLQARLMPAILDADKIVPRVNILLQAAERLRIPVTVTEQYPQGLGPTVAAVTEVVPDGAVVLPKTSFSAAGDPAIVERMTALRGAGRNQLVICGVESHVCVLQTALGFRNAGYEIFVVADAVSSRSAHSVSAACARLLHADCHWVTAEMVVFEWLEQAATEDFRALSRLLR